MNYGEKLAYVVSAMHRSEVEHLRTRGKVDGLIFHRTGIARAGGINRPCVGSHFQGERQYRVVTVVGRVLHLNVECGMLNVEWLRQGRNVEC